MIKTILLTIITAIVVLVTLSFLIAVVKTLFFKKHKDERILENFTTELIENFMKIINPFNWL